MNHYINNNKMKGTILYIVFHVHLVFSVELRIDPLVRIEQGLVRGQQANYGNYSTFLGIPYAQVDIDNPFGSTQPHPGFGSEVFNAYSSIKCPQSQSGTETAEQSLDCLRLNIFVPNEANSRNLLPVLVHIHGGGFSSGSALDNGVHNFMEHGIVIVSLNYRLGPYGFLCLDDPTVPGNQGLKDQYEALQWVKNNTAAFGGNPEDVTITGGSAGSCSVLLQLYSPKEKVFNKVIAQSGTPKNEGMFVKGDINAALKIADHLGLNATNTEEALAVLSKMTPDLVIAANEELNLELRPCKERNFNGVEIFVESDPFSLFNESKVRYIPIMIGHTNQEHDLNWLFRMYGDDYFDKDPFYEKLKNNFNFNEEELINISNILRHYYIGDQVVSIDLASDLANFDSDFVFNHSVERMIRDLLEQNASPVFQYVFSYTSDPNVGATHGSDVRYIFPGLGVESELDQLVTKRLTSLWSNFIKFGNPTPEITDLLPLTWEPVSKTIRPYLDIDSDLQLKNRVYKERMAFWDLFYSIYTNHSVLIDE